MGQERRMGRTGRRAGGWLGGVSALPRAQGWCGRALGSSGTWLASEFYCEPARAWHSHENGYGRTEGRKERMKESGGKGGREQRREADARGEAAGEGGSSGAAVCFIVVVLGRLQRERF